MIHQATVVQTALTVGENGRLCAALVLACDVAEDDASPEWIAGVLDACGVQTWEQLRGRVVVVEHNADGQVVAVEALPTEPGGRFEFPTPTSEEDQS